MARHRTPDPQQVDLGRTVPGCKLVKSNQTARSRSQDSRAKTMVNPARSYIYCKWRPVWIVRSRDARDSSACTSVCDSAPTRDYHKLARISGGSKEGSREHGRIPNDNNGFVTDLSGSLSRSPPSTEIFRLASLESQEYFAFFLTNNYGLPTHVKKVN